MPAWYNRCPNRPRPGSEWSCALQRTVGGAECALGVAIVSASKTEAERSAKTWSKVSRVEAVDLGVSHAQSEVVVDIKIMGGRER